ncbi:MAG: alkaline phosphatase family protein, partial [Pseudomonadota bacterium]
MKRFLSTAALLAATLSGAHAETFLFSYAFGDGPAITGSMSGHLQGNLLQDISDIHILFNGHAFTGSLFQAAWSDGANDWDAAHGAVVSTVAGLNNFMFADANVPQSYAVNNYFYFVNSAAMGQQAFAVNYNIDGDVAYDAPVNASWSLTPAPVPEPEHAAMLLGGLGLIAALARRRRVLAGGALLALGASAVAAPLPVTIRGVVSGSYFVPPVVANSPSASRAASSSGSVFEAVKVCVDSNDNGLCDAGEASTLTRADGSFLLASRSPGALVAEVSATARNAGHPVTERMVLRAPADQVQAALINPLVPARVAVTPLTTEMARMMDDERISFEAAKNHLATRLGVTPDHLLGDLLGAGGELLKESVILSKRFELAAKMVDRHDVSPAALAADPAATGPAITMKEAQLAVMNLEGIPRYDHVFLIVLENKATASIKGSIYAPRINAWLNAGNQFTSYYATGNPSEPNRLAFASGDDFGITDDSAFNCIPTGTAAVNAVEDLPLPPGVNSCTNATNHNLKNRANLFNALAAKGMSWRVYSESNNANGDWRRDGVGDITISAPDHLYTAGEPVGAIGTPGLQVRLAGALYAAKHNGSVFFQNVRSSPDFLKNNRTLGGGQWDAALAASPAAPVGWNPDQFGDDLQSGDVGQLNILEPDQCDDMHGVTLVGTQAGVSGTKAASDCAGNALIYRGDKYTDYLIRKIQASPLWNNPAKRVAIVMMFDEGTATSGFNSCCGWNTS